MQTAIVILIVVAAAIFLIRRFYNSVKKGAQSSCGCNCEGCNLDQAQDCTDFKKKPQQ